MGNADQTVPEEPHVAGQIEKKKKAAVEEISRPTRCHELLLRGKWNLNSGNIGGKPVPVYSCAELKQFTATPEEWRRVRVVGISDTHCRHSQCSSSIPDGDILVSCGDFAHRCTGVDQLHEFNDWLGTLPHKHKIVIAGNQEYACTEYNRVEMQRKVFTNCVYLMDSTHVAEGITFYGSPWNGSRGMAFSSDKTKRAQKFSKIPPCDVLVTHTPPLEILDLAADGNHWGDPALREYLLNRNNPAPRVHLFGHTHLMYGYEQSGDGRTTFINCAMKHEEGLRQPVVFDFFVRQKC